MILVDLGIIIYHSCVDPGRLGEHVKI